MVRLLVWIKHHLLFIWNFIEKINSLLFKIFWARNIDIKMFPKTVNGVMFKILSQNDMEDLAIFFSKQPESAFQFFKPHGFDVSSLKKKQKR